MARNPDVSHINERRLRPIYDCLDNGNNKKALQEADKVLKKQKDLLCAKVLKALALLRLGKHEDSLQILKEVHSDSPTDDSTLQAMTICYRELHKIELIADAYEKAIKKDPLNEEFHSHLFMAFVRLSDYKRQQMAALGLYKLKPKNPYYFWAVMSILMQAITANDPNIAQKITLPLAEKMCKKFLDENRIEAEAEVELYLMILEKQKKYNEMITIMDSPIGDKLNNVLGFVSKRKAELLRLMDRHEDAFQAYKQLIDNNTDQIEYYLELIEVSTVLDNNLSKDQNQSSFHYISSLIGFIDDCIQKGKNSSEPKLSQRQRGPYLAKMILFDVLKKRQQTQGDVEHLLITMSQSITDLLFDYYLDFGSKHVCIYDMFYILDKTKSSEEEIQTLILQMKHSIEDISGNDSDLNEMYFKLCFHYFNHFCGQNDSIGRESRLSLVQHLTEKYENYYQNIVLKSDLTATEPQPTDPFIILIASILFVNPTEVDDSLISQTIITIEWALNKSPANHTLKLILLKLYNMIGAVGASYSLLESLDIKHIQYDSLGYLFFNPLMTSGHFNASSHLLGNALKFYSANFKDTLDYLISCYKFGSFTKVEEILKLRDRLNNSLQYCLSAVERMVLDLILETKNHSSTENIINYMEIDCKKDKFVWHQICDNRDFTVIRSNHQKNDQNLKEIQIQTFSDEILWLKIRNLIIRSIAAANNVVLDLIDKKNIINNNTNTKNETTNGNETQNELPIDVLTDLSLKFKEYIDLVKTSKFSQTLLSLEAPNPSRIVSFSQFSHFEVILDLIQFIIRLNSEPKDSLEESLKSGDIFASIVDSLEESVKTTTSLLTIRSTLEQLTNTVETLSIALIYIGIIQSVMKYKLNIMSNKKIRRKKDNPNKGSNDLLNDCLIKIYVSLVSKFELSAQRIDKIIKSIDILNIFSNSFVVSTQLSENQSIVSSIVEKIEKSYIQSMKEFSELLQNKSLYLNSLQI